MVDTMVLKPRTMDRESVIPILRNLFNKDYRCVTHDAFSCCYDPWATLVDTF